MRRHASSAVSDGDKRLHTLQRNTFRYFWRETNPANGLIPDNTIAHNVPVSIARSLGADVVIAVDVNAEGAKFLGPTLSIIGVVIQAMLVVQRTASQTEINSADLVLKPHVGHIRWDEMARANELLEAGREAVVENLTEIRKLIEDASKSAPKWYNFRRSKAN